MKLATSIQHVDNDRVRVTEWRFEPGSHTGWHRHEFDYVITPVFGGLVHIQDHDGNRSPFEMVPGKTYFREVGVEHDVINISDHEIRFVETEIK